MAGATTEFKPREKQARPAADERREPAYRPEPITDPPKQSKADQLLQHKREQAGLGIMQLLAFGAGLLGRFKIAPVLPEDVAAIAVHSPGIAKGMADVAAEDEKFARVFDRVTAMGPYGALVEAVVPLAMQIAANHNKGIRAGTLDPASMGAMHPDALMAMMGGNGDGPSDTSS